MRKAEPKDSKPIRVTEQAYTRVEEIVANMRARGLSVNKKSIVSELIMLCPVPQPQEAEKKRRTRKAGTSMPAVTAL